MLLCFTTFARFKLYFACLNCKATFRVLMGASLTRAAQWTTASSGSICKLETTPINELLLKDILHFVEQFGSRHPQEAAHVFEEPLQWTSTLVASDFNTDYDIRFV